MSFYKWFKGRFSDRAKATSLYKRGMGKARRHDHEGAVDDYTATIKMDDVPADIKAMALYNRALVHVAVGNDQGAKDDLNAVLGMNAGHVNIRTMAKQMLFRMDSRTQRGADRREANRLSNGGGHFNQKAGQFHG